MSENPLIDRILSTPWLAEGIALIGSIWYLIQLWVYSHGQESVLDEGAYLYKGYLFATGQYSPYQPYGPWTNHMALSFLIPGYIQRLFGPGIRTGRYFAIFAAMLMLLSLWILARRFGGRWWAAAAVWIFIWNPAMAKMYSVAVSQVLVATMLMWALVLVLGEEQPLWQLILGSVLAGMSIMTRINMLPLLPLLVLYVFWQHGKKAGILSGLTGLLPVVIGHALYWPDILQMWTRLPRELTPFLDNWRVPRDYLRSWKPDVPTAGRILSFFHGIRFHFAAMIGALAAGLLWPRHEGWKNQSQFRVSVFLAALFVSLLGMHMWAALGKDYCVFCLAGYLTFFSVLGLLILIVSFSAWRRQIPGWGQILIAIVIVGVSAGIGFGAFEDIGNQLLDFGLPAVLVGSSKTGAVTLRELLSNKFGLETMTLRRLAPTMLGLVVGIAILILAWGVSKISTRLLPAKTHDPPTFGFFAVGVFLLIGILLSPTLVLGGGYRTYDCPGDVISSYEAAGEHLAQNIPPDSLVYWKGGLSTVPLLYVPGIKIFPPQLNIGYSLFTIGEPDTLLRLGYWNRDMANQWAEEADYVLIEERSYKGWLKDVVLAGDFEELELTPPTVSCRGDAQIRIFKRQP